MRELHIDIETFSEVDLKKTGVYPYAQHESFKIIIFAYAWDKQPVTVLDTYDDEHPGQSLPDDVWYALCDPNVKKIAHNANFEITCISAYFGLPLDPRQWYCTMIGAAYLGLPLSLDKIAQVLGLSEQKDTGGKALITYFSKPCKPTKRNGMRTRNRPNSPPVEFFGEKVEAEYMQTVLTKWEGYKAYGGQDVRTECKIYEYLKRFPAISDIEREYWIQDQEINARGIYIDVELAQAAVQATEDFLRYVHEEIIRLTGVSNPNSPTQLRDWLSEELGEEVKSLNKIFLEEALNDELLPDNVARVFKLRQLGSRTSSGKYDAMLKYVCENGRACGTIQYYGANRTGRYAGRGIQPQNMKKTPKSGLETAREALRKGLVDILYDDPTDIISRLVRTAIIAEEGKSLISCDFSAIEGRVLSWLAAEEWKLDIYNGHGKMYEAVAAKMFSVPIEAVTKDSDYRAKGKIAELALGYQGSKGALFTMGALREGLTEDELMTIVKRWRAANPRIVKFWYEVEAAAKHAINTKGRAVLRKPYCTLLFTFDRGYLFITLPSGRRLAYYGAHLRPGKFGDSITYWGMDQVKKIWTRIDTYGGSLVENITQAIARDCLTDAMYRMKDDVYLTMHVHDEIVAEEPDEVAAAKLELMEEVMLVSPLWAKTLPLKGEGYVSKFYKKD